MRDEKKKKRRKEKTGIRTGKNDEGKMRRARRKKRER